MNYTYEFTLKEGPKVKMENFIGTKSWRKILEGLKWKVGIFIGTKNIFNHGKLADVCCHGNILFYSLSTWNNMFLAGDMKFSFILMCLSWIFSMALTSSLQIFYQKTSDWFDWDYLRFYFRYLNCEIWNYLKLGVSNLNIFSYFTSRCVGEIII